MKNVYLLGDKVRFSTDGNFGYGIFVMDELEGEAYVYSAQDDCGSTEHTLRHLHEWARRSHVDPETIDAVHWNNGLWDVVRIMGDDPITPMDLYADRLEKICRRIRRLFPNAQVIFATTTPVVESEEGSVRFRNADIEAYNAAAVRALAPYGVLIDDLYAAAKDFGLECYRTGEYFSIEGARRLGKAAAESIRACF